MVKNVRATMDPLTPLKNFPPLGPPSPRKKDAYRLPPIGNAS